MKEYRALRLITLPGGTKVVLTKDQVRRRKHLLIVGNDGVCTIKDGGTNFKVGETFTTDYVFGRTLLDTVECLTDQEAVGPSPDDPVVDPPEVEPAVEGTPTKGRGRGTNRKRG